MVSPVTLDQVLAVLRAQEADLRQRGVTHAAIFGSLVRGSHTPSSDIDLMIDLDPANVPDLFTYIGIALDLERMFGRRVDLSVRENLKPYIRPAAEAEAVYAF